MRKIIMLIFVTFITSGCDVNYELYYKSPDSILETINVEVSNSNALLFSNSIECYVDDIFNGWKDSYNLENYKYKLSVGNVTSKVEILKEHNYLQSVIQNNAISSFFKNSKVYNVGDKTTLELTDYIYGITEGDEEIFLDEYDEDSCLYITIRSNYKLQSNADEINNLTGTYKWVFTSNSINKTLKVSFSREVNICAYLFNLLSVILLPILSVMIIGTILIFVVIIIIKKKKSSNI